MTYKHTLEESISGIEKMIHNRSFQISWLRRVLSGEKVSFYTIDYKRAMRYVDEIRRLRIILAELIFLKERVL